MSHIADARADAVIDAAKADHRPAQVLGGARVEQRLAGSAARTPELAPVLARADAELAVELLGRQAAQRLLVEDRDVAPMLGALQPLTEKRRSPGLLQRPLLAFILDLLELLSRSRKGEVHTVPYTVPHVPNSQARHTAQRAARRGGREAARERARRGSLRHRFGPDAERFPAGPALAADPRPDLALLQERDRH